MASPFRLFRKHQRAFLAVAAVLAIFLFVIGDALMGCVGQAPAGSGGPNVVVTTWDGGELRSDELNMLVQRRFFVAEVLANIHYLGKARAEAAGEKVTQPNIPTFFLSQNATVPEVAGACVEERVMADQARAAGMNVSDMMINDFLRKTGFELVSDEDLKIILQGVRRMDLRTSEELLFSGLRELLLGSLYANSVGSALMSVSPEQLWTDWRQLNDRIVVEAVRLPAASFVAEVPEPSESQLIAFFEQYKMRVGGQPVSTMGVELPAPDPGFGQPQRVKLKYLLGDVTAWTQNMLESVTETEIADYYERNKRAQFVKSDSKDEQDASEDKEAKDDADDDSEEDESREDNAEEADAEESSADKAGEEKADEETDAADSDEDVEYVPLEEVKDDIRNKLANDKAVVELKQAMEGAYSELTSIYNRYGGEVISAQADEKEPPAPPERLADLGILAKEKKLTFEETVPLSARDLFETMVGKAVETQSGARNVTQAAFTDLKLYEPLLAQDIDGYWYLVLKVEDLPSRVPELSEVREEVVQAWKLREASALALKKAEELAKQAQESGKTLKDFFAGTDNEVISTDLFSWITFGSTPNEMQQGPRLGDAPPLTAIGPEFMQRVFSLQGLEVAALLNFDRSEALVVQVARHERPEEELHRAFLNEVNNSQAVVTMERMRAMNTQRMQLQRVLERVNLDLRALQEYFLQQQQAQANAQ